MRQGETIRARKKALDEVLVKLASAPLSGRAVDLVALYEGAEFEHRQRTATFLGVLTIVLLLGLAFLFFSSGSIALRFDWMRPLRSRPA